ncbi:MAG: two-component regulator propeller domain-containing protein [Bacteroidales bacterium]|jgi:ligand-binding sensor domain-containing protein/serine phosphatase RsbU (regulator of sigma subunit)
MRIKFRSDNTRVIGNIILMTLFFALPLINLNAQTYFFENYSVEQGLSSSKVYSVIQDRNDWIWLGTESGVSRFNGSKFENFSSRSGMAGGGVKSLAEDSLGRIWFGHMDGGLSVYDKGKFMKLRFDSIEISGDVTSIRQKGGKLWITTMSNGAILANFPARGDTILTGRQYRGKEGLSDQVSSTCIDNNKDFYCITPPAGIKKFNPSKNVFETFLPEGLTKYFNVIVMYQDKKGNYWYGTFNGGLYKYDVDSGKMRIFDVRDGLSKNWISYITEDYLGKVWVGTFGGGVTVFNGNEMTVYNNLNGLQAATIQCITEDNEKNVIIADRYTGISIYKGNHFVTWSDNNFLPDKSVFAVEEDELGRYWFGSNAGISIFDPKAKADKALQYLNSTISKVRFIKSDKQGSVWIGTEGFGLYRYDIKTGKFIYETKINGYLQPNGIITAMLIDKEKRLWIGNQDRLAMFDAKNGEVSYYTQENGLAGSSITALFCDNDNNIWIGSEEKTGLTKYNSSTGKFSIIKIGEGYIPKTIAQTPDKRIWVGTTSGLLGLKNDSVVVVLNEINGLLSDNVKLLQPQGNRFLYIGTNYGLNRYNLSDNSIASFTKRNGFPGIETNPNAVVTDSRGNIWFGTANGVTRLDPELMPPVNKNPAVHLSAMEVNYLPRVMKRDMKLNYKEKNILFNYYSVSLTDPDAVKFKVMMKGFDSDWEHPSVMTMKDYPLLPGHYTFRVKASNSYGYWNETPVEYSFTIRPPFYETPWFIAICLGAIAIAIISYIKIREQNLIREKKILEQKVKERTAEVVQKSMEIEEKNRDITASIRYAERIQRAMLPRENSFHDTFVLYMPKDIVSGDFYWMYDNGDTQFMAACDCTGHGVPGAFMSIIGHNSLNKVVREYGIIRPGAILDQLNAEVVKALMQRNEETINDGMDLALTAFNRKNFTLEFAGAYNPLYLVRKGELILYKGDRFPIGMSSLQARKNFQNQQVEIQPGDMLYMSSDGYADQFGFADGKKYKSGNVKKLLVTIWNLPMDEQRERLKKEILDWKGDLPQVDDIMFIGTRVPDR